VARRRVTVSDVAREAGTSTAVVSYVLNDGPRPVSPSSRARVLAAIKKLDYTPDRIARALRQRKTGLVGLVIPDVTLPFFGSLARALEHEVLSHGQLLITGNTNFDPSQEVEVARGLIGAGVDGLLLVSETDGQGAVSLVGKTGTTAVWLHHRPDDDGAAVVMSDHCDAGAQAVRHLVEAHARRRVLFLGGPTARGATHERYLGYEAAASALGVQWGAGLPTDLSPPVAYGTMREVLRSGSDVDAVVVSTYGQATAVMRAVFDSGMSVPGDLSLVSFDGAPRADYRRPTITTLQQDVPAIARTAVSLLGVPSASTTTPDAASEPFRTSLRIGESCGCTP